MASNSTSPTQGTTGDGYECNMNNQCVTIISIGTYFALIFFCSCCTLSYRCLQRINFIDEREEAATRRQQQQQQQQPKEDTRVENPIRASVADEDPC